VTTGGRGNVPGVEPDGVCPVCLWPDRGDPVCRVCGWELVGGYLLGPVTRAAQYDFAARLTEAQRRYDLRAAARVAGPAGERDDAAFSRLSALARGRGAAPDQGEQAADGVDRADLPMTPAQAGVGFALRRLVAGVTEAIAFVEIGPDEIAVQTLVAGAYGVPEQPIGDRLPWTDFLPLLPINDDLRRLRMAGGVGVPANGSAQGGDRSWGPGPVTAATLVDLVEDAITPVLSRMMAVADAAVSGSRADSTAAGANSMPPRPPYRLDVVLVRRTYRWRVLDKAIDCARAFLRPVALLTVSPRSGDLAAVVEDIAVQAPLRYGYDAVLAEVPPAGGASANRERLPVTIRPVELFAAGSAILPGMARTESVDVAAVSRHAAAKVALPIVVRRSVVTDFRDPAALKRDRPLLAMGALNGASRDPVTLRVRLLRPGLVEIDEDEPGLLPPATAPAWPALVTGVPDWLPVADPRAGGLDLVLLVELGGEAHVVAERVRLARAVVDEFRDEPRRVQLAVLGYRDHFGRHNVDAIGVADDEDEALIVGCGLRPPRQARLVFDQISHPRRWQAVPVGDYYAAPLEDALQLILGNSEQWGWQPKSQHVLLVIGGRPPHPARVAAYPEEMLPCPHRRSWEEALSRLRAEQAVRCYAVLDRPVARGYSEYAWRQLSPLQGPYRAGSVTAEQLARVVGPAPRTPAIELSLATLVNKTPGRARASQEAGR
jgi:hypothetical protein